MHLVNKIVLAYGLLRSARKDKLRHCEAEGHCSLGEQIELGYFAMLAKTGFVTARLKAGAV
jgi:hypothetical protein